MQTSVYFVGAGPGDPGLLTLKGRDLLERADVVIYAGSLVNPDVLGFAPPRAELIDSAPLNLDAIAGHMLRASRSGKTVVRLHTGEPSVYGAIAEQMAALSREGIGYEVVPGVSSAFAAAASLKMEYTLPGVTQTLIFTRRAGRTPVPDSEAIPKLASHQSSMAIFLSAGMLESTVRELIEGGYPEDTPAAVVYRASWPDEKCVGGTLATIVERVKPHGISRQALILVGAAVGRNLQEPSRLYAPEFYHGFRLIQGKKREGTAVIAVTRRGWHTGRKILRAMDDIALYVPDKFKQEEPDSRIRFYRDLRSEVESAFRKYANIVLLMATGIAVRMIAPLLVSKWEDPAVVAADEGGRNVVSLISGHWGGANELAEKLSHLLDGNPVITTESDVMGFPSIDMLVKRLTGGAVPEKKSALKDVQAIILDGGDVGFFPEELSELPEMKGHPNLHFFDSIDALFRSDCRAGLIVSHRVLPLIDVNCKLLLIHPRSLVVGIGCHRGTTAQEIEGGVASVFESLNLSTASLARVCSIDAKRDESGLVAYARKMEVPLMFFSAGEINRIKTVSPVSEHALRAVGARGVAEPCALLGSGGGRLLSHKVKLRNMTVAVAARPLRKVIDESREDGDG